MKLTITNVTKNPSVPVSTPLGVCVSGTPLAGLFLSPQLEKMSADLEYLRVTGYITYVISDDAATADAVELATRAESLLNFGVTVGAKGAVVANAIECAVQLQDALGAALAGQKEVFVETLAATDAQGVLAAAGTPVGVLNKVLNPATGLKLGWFTTTAAGLFSFRVTDTVVEACMVRLSGPGFKTLVLKLQY